MSVTEQAQAVARKLDLAMGDHVLLPEVAPMGDRVHVHLDLEDARRLTDLLKETDADR